MSYLVTADGLRILFDVGLSGGPQATLATNAQALGVDLAAIDVVVISHTHLDHTGGPVAALRRRVKIPDPTREVEDVNTLMPVSTRHRQARAVPAANARVLAAGVATTGTIPRMLFFLGWTPEQALMVNVRDRGVVVIVGCGHQGVERLLARVEALVQAPIYAVVGGLHLPVHGLPAQDLIGTARWPWQQTTERDVTEAIETLSRRKPHLVALSPHDSSPWTLDRFATAFAASYRTIRVGDEIHISAHASSPAPNQPPEHRSHPVNGQLQTEMTTTLGAVR